MDKNKLIGYLCALGYAIFIGFAFIFSKGAIGYGVLDQLAYREFIAFFVLLIVAFFNRNLINLTKEKIAKILGLVFFFHLLFFGIQTYGLSITSSLEAGVAQAMAPVVTLIFASLLLNEKTNIWQKLSILLSVGGVVYIIARKQLLNPNPDFKGLGILFLGTVAFSLYSVIVRKLKGEATSLEILLVIMGEAAFVFMTLAIVVSLRTKGSLQPMIAPLSDSKFLISVLYLGLGASLLSGVLLNNALQRIEASKVVIFNNLATVIQIFSGAFILKEDLFFSHKVGSVCIVLGVLGTNFLGKKKKPEPPIEPETILETDIDTQAGTIAETEREIETQEDADSK